MLTRRRFLASTATLALVAMVAPSWPLEALAQRADMVDVAELMKAGPLPEKGEGDPNAKVTIIEYLSMTCPHCAHFHATTYPMLKEKYISTGKVYFVLREFPLDALAAAGFMLARNAPGDKYFEVVDVLFTHQKEWAYTDDPVSALRNLSKQFGYAPATFDQTLSDQKLLDAINATRSRGADVFGVNSTPTFFINGERVRGALSPDEMQKKLDGLLAG